MLESYNVTTRLTEQRQGTMRPFKRIAIFIVRECVIMRGITIQLLLSARTIRLVTIRTYEMLLIYRFPTTRVPVPLSLMDRFRLTFLASNFPRIFTYLILVERSCAITSDLRNDVNANDVIRAMTDFYLIRRRLTWTSSDSELCASIFISSIITLICTLTRVMTHHNTTLKLQFLIPCARAIATSCGQFSNAIFPKYSIMRSKDLRAKFRLFMK